MEIVSDFDTSKFTFVQKNKLNLQLLHSILSVPPAQDIFIRRWNMFIYSFTELPLSPDNSKSNSTSYRSEAAWILEFCFKSPTCQLSNAQRHFSTITNCLDLLLLWYMNLKACVRLLCQVYLLAIFLRAVEFNYPQISSKFLCSQKPSYLSQFIEVWLSGLSLATQVKLQLKT